MKSARAVAELAIQQETSLAQMATSNRLVNAPIRDLLSTDNVRTKTIVDGRTESGRTARVLDIKSAASLAGTATKTLQPIIAPMMISRAHVNDAQRHQTVS